MSDRRRAGALTPAALPKKLRSPNPRQWLADRRRNAGLREAVARLCVPPPPHRWGGFGRSIVVPPARVDSPECIWIGDGVVVLENVWFSVVRHFADITPRLVIEDLVRVGRGCQFSVIGEVTVGRGAIIGDFVQIGDTFHPYETEDRLPELTRPQPVHIGPGAVLAGHVVVLPGVTIGPGAYVDHHAVVTADVPAGAVMRGNPARPAPLVSQ